MPTSMTASHGGVLYYVVKVPKDDPALDCGTAVATHRYLEEKRTLLPSPLNADSDGWDNPFRPDGDLSKEADQIVELIKEGKPITPTPTSTTSPLLTADHAVVDGKHDQQQQPTAASTPAKANGTRADKNAVPPNVEVQRGTVINGNEPSQVEHVVLKKKPKCRCCAVQ